MTPMIGPQDPQIQRLVRMPVGNWHVNVLSNLNGLPNRWFLVTKRKGLKAVLGSVLVPLKKPLSIVLLPLSMGCSVPENGFETGQVNMGSRKSENEF